MSDLSRKWFRLKGSGSSTDDAESASASTQDRQQNTIADPSKLERFCSSLRQIQSASSPLLSRKKSYSPHFQKKHKAESNSVDGLHGIRENDFNSPAASSNFKNNEGRRSFKISSSESTSKMALKLNPVPRSDPNPKSSIKKPSLKSLKNAEMPKKKLHRGIYNCKQSSNDEVDAAATKKSLNAKTNRIQTDTIFPPNSTSIKVYALPDDDDDDDDDDEDEDDEDDEDDDKVNNDDSNFYADSSDVRSNVTTARLTIADNLPYNGKEKILLTDRKFRNNRIEKSSSKTKISDLDKRESVKRSCSNRKIYQNPALIEESKAGIKGCVPKENKRQPRNHTTLNLQALVNFVVNNRKCLNSDEFNLIRRKSISDAAAAVIQVAATCKPLPIALKYPQDRVVADVPNENDVKRERNVVLVKKQPLKTSFYDRFLNSNSNSNPVLKPPSKDKKSSISSCSKVLENKTSTKVKRNSSNSSKSSGNFEDEAFYSGDEAEELRLREEEKQMQEQQQNPNGKIGPKQKESTPTPSLTSRMAAKINETTSNYRSRKQAIRNNKTRINVNAVDSNPKSELFKQLSVERFNSTAIQRHPSDRRPDIANISLRSNGNTSTNLNASDLHNSVLGADDSTGTTVGDGAQGTASGAEGTNQSACGTGFVAGQTVGVPSALPGTVCGPNDTKAQDATEGLLRRERLHHQHQQNKSAPVSVSRSESYKERLSHKRNRSQRKTSDPNLTSRPNDDQADLGLSNTNFATSSNSSLSSGGGSESPSTSMEQMGGVGANTSVVGTTLMHQQPQHQHQHSHQDSFHSSIGGSSNTSFWGGSATNSQLTRHWNYESEDEDDLNEADWSSNVAADVLASLTDAEKKRQEIINEIYQTERSHVRTLKLLERLFFYPLQDSGLLSHDHMHLLFPPSLLSLCDLHGSFEHQLKQRRIDDCYVVNSIGDLLAAMFDGKSGDELREFAAQFCARQQIALEALKEKRRKDEQLQKLLSKAESHKSCRRLQLKDLLPTVLQRLTKYPLLFENLYKVTLRVVPDNMAEAEAIQKALESSKKILVDVNQAVKTAEDAHKLQNIQRKLDKSTFDKDEFRNLDLTQYRLIHDGNLTMKKNPGIQLHGLLFETMIVLLTKQDDKYSLKYLHAPRNTEVNNKPVSPIMSIDSETLVRQEAADKNSFFLIKTKTSQMLELRAPSSSECKTWFKHISDAAEQYKPRSKNATHEPVDDPAIATLPHSNTRESLELTPDRPPPLSATATVVTTPLAPMMPIATIGSERNVFGPGSSDVQLRNGGNDNAANSAGASNDSYPPYYNVKQRLSHNGLSAQNNGVNRTMSTRSCGNANHNYSNTSDFPGSNGVTLRHTQSARQANGSVEDNNFGAAGNKRDSASIVCSNNSNNTRTLMQSSPPLVEPTAIQISISPAHTAEPVLTSAEKLRRLDASIRDGLMEKQKIICDMFRLPFENFNEIVDIAAMPEAPKDSTDIALAAYAQVQSLTEVMNEYMNVTLGQEVSAVSTAVCDKCHENQVLNRKREAWLDAHSTDGNDIPPPLPPPNRQVAQAQHQTVSPLITKVPTGTLEAANIHEDDDGYCEIDELRLPALPPLLKTTAVVKDSPFALPSTKNDPLKPGAASPPLPPPVGSFKTPPPPPPLPSPAKSESVVAELVKRQSIISADSIPEESADELTKALDEQPFSLEVNQQPPETLSEDDSTTLQSTSNAESESAQTANTLNEESPITTHEDVETNAPIATVEDDEDNHDDLTVPKAELEGVSNTDKLESNTDNEDCAKPLDSASTSPMTAEPQRQSINMTQAVDTSPGSEHIETIDAHECLSSLHKLNAALSVMVDNSTQTRPETPTLPVTSSSTPKPTIISSGSISCQPALCGPNRIQHANFLEPSVPCYALSSIVSTLNSQISLLLPKINERDTERERLRKENQHLRELLNAMHERQRVESKLETPSGISRNKQAATDDEDIGLSPTAVTTTNTKTSEAQKLEN